MKNKLLSLLILLGATKVSAVTNTILSSNGVYNLIQQYAVSGSITNAYRIIPTTATSAQVQAAVNAGGVVWFTPSAYPYVLSNIYITNPVSLIGNGVVIKPAAGVSNILFDNYTNMVGDRINISDFSFDGGVSSNYFSGPYYQLLNGTPTTYYNPYWSNLTGIRLNSANGGKVENCRFYNWPGNGMLMLNTMANNAYTNRRIDIVNCTFYSNFVGLFIVGFNYENKGYYNNSYGSEPTASSEYQGIRGSIFLHNYIGLCDGAGNAQVQGNFFTRNRIGFYSGSAPNAQHGLYQGNTFNHNTLGAWQEAGNSGQWRNNNFLANAAGGFIGGSITELQMEGNWFGGNADTVIITNVSTGRFAYNSYQGTWASFAPTITNTVAVFNNRSTTVAGDTDGGGIRFGSNYNATLFGAVTSQPKLVWSNNVLYAVTDTKTNVVTDAR